MKGIELRSQTYDIGANSAVDISALKYPHQKKSNLGR
jgi:hypothetical protein